MSTAAPRWDLPGSVYGDFDTGQIWSLDLVTKENKELADTDQFIPTFGVGENQGALRRRLFR
jgi:hypothetical protein